MSNQSKYQKPIKIEALSYVLSYFQQAPNPSLPVKLVKFNNLELYCNVHCVVIIANNFRFNVTFYTPFTPQKKMPVLFYTEKKEQLFEFKSTYELINVLMKSNPELPLVY